MSTQSSTSSSGFLSLKKLEAAKSFIKFINQAPSPFHAVSVLASELKQRKSAIQLSEEDPQPWALEPRKTYLLTRNQSAMIAFSIGPNYRPGGPMAIVATHTDSPCLKLKPRTYRKPVGNCLQVGVQTYGGGLWHTWFDRDLSLAGRVMVKRKSGDTIVGVKSELLDLKGKPILRIPNLAIHLNREVREKFQFNSETHLSPVISSAIEDHLNSENNQLKKEKSDSGQSSVLMDILAKELNCEVDDIIDFELCLYDAQPSAIGGARDEFIFSARLDNLMMSYCATESLAECPSMSDDDDCVRVIAMFDNEEVGSDSGYGAGSNMLESFIRRFSSDFASSVSLPYSQTFADQVFASSFLISADMAHALHPNYPEKHEAEHKPLFGQGPVIKINANQRYATTSYSSTLVKLLCGTDAMTGKTLEADENSDEYMRKIPIQEFVVRNDMPCGSTIGPILSTKLGMKCIDIGWPMLSMHSIREMGHVVDIESATTLFMRFFQQYSHLKKLISQ